MTTKTNINKSIFLIFSILTILLSGLLSLLNLSEFYQIVILNKTEGYPFDGDGPTPYFYKTAKLYSTVNLIWGLSFLTMLLLTIWTVFKGQRKNIFWLLGLTILLILGQFLHGLIEIE